MKFKLTVTIENKIISDADYEKMNLDNLLVFDFRSQNKALKLIVKQGWVSPVQHTRQFNASVPHQGHSFSAPKKRQFHTNVSVPHEFVSSSRGPILFSPEMLSFHTNASVPHQFVSSTQNFSYNFYCGTDAFVLNWGVERTRGTDGFWAWKGVALVWNFWLTNEGTFQKNECP